ncbi:adenylate/guanylate cyclase domain-containing protein, partial [Rhizobium ruizarguesonis]
SRLCSSADDRQILVDHAVAQSVRVEILLVALGPRQLKGFDEQIPAWKVVTRSGRSNGVHEPIEGLNV